MSVNVYACCINYHKAFDFVRHDKLIEILNNTGVDREENKVILQLYGHQTAELTIDGDTSEATIIRRGVRQGCILSPMPFNILFETIFKKALDDILKGIKENNVINNIRYAENTIVLADNTENLQFMRDRIVQYSREHGLYINIKETKLLVFAKININVYIPINALQNKLNS